MYEYCSPLRNSFFLNSDFESRPFRTKTSHFSVPMSVCALCHRYSCHRYSSPLSDFISPHGRTHLPVVTSSSPLSLVNLHFARGLNGITYTRWPEPLLLTPSLSKVTLGYSAKMHGSSEKWCCSVISWL